jgi:hypothetical protein
MELRSTSINLKKDYTDKISMASGFLLGYCSDLAAAD